MYGIGNPVVYAYRLLLAYSRGFSFRFSRSTRHVAPEANDAEIYISGLGSNIGHGLYVGWVEHSDITCWVSFLNPTYLLAIFVLSAKPNKMAEDIITPIFSFYWMKIDRRNSEEACKR